MKVVRVVDVSKHYQMGTQTVTALQDVTMAVEAGEFMAIAGPSGSGKSTLLNLIGCIDTPSSGGIFLYNKRVSRGTPDQLANVRARVLGFIFQTFNLLPVLSAWENVEYPLLYRKDIDRRDRKSRVDEYLSVVGLTGFAKHRPNQLSGGQRQRVAIARALAGRPKIVLADEPTANLDSATGQGILELMQQMNKREKTTFIFSTHDARVIEMAHRVVWIRDGRIADPEQHKSVG